MAVSVGAITAQLDLRDKMSRKLDAATKKLEQFSKKAKASGERLKKVGTTMTSIGNQARSAGMAMTVGISAPLLLIGKQAAESFGEFESSMNRVRAVSGATGADFQKLEAQARELGATTRFSATESATAMGFFGLAGFKTKEILDAMPGTLDLAAAGMMDVGAAADIASKTLRGYGFEATDIGRVSDVMAKAFTEANTDLTQLGNAMRYAGPVAKSAGVQFEETAAAMSLMADAGFQGTMGGTALRGAIAKLLSPTKEGARIMNEFGLQATDATGRLLPLDDIVRQLEPHAEQTGKMLELFGLRAGPAMAALVGRGADALSNLTEKLEESGGTAKRIADIQMEGLKGAFIILQSAAEGMWISIGERLAPALTTLIERLTAAANYVSNTVVPAFGRMPPILQEAALAMAALGIAGPPLLMIFGQMMLSVGSLIYIYGTFTASSWSLARALDGVRLRAGYAWAALAGPVGLAVGATAAVFAIIRYIQKSKEAAVVTDDMRDAIEKARVVAFGFEEAWLKLTKRQKESPEVIKEIREELDAMGDAARHVSPVIVKQIEAAENALKELKGEATGLHAEFAEAARSGGPLKNYAGTLDEVQAAADIAAKELQDMLDVSADLARQNNTYWLDRTTTSLRGVESASDALNLTLATLAPSLGGTGEEAEIAGEQLEGVAEAIKKIGFAQARENLAKLQETWEGLSEEEKINQAVINDVGAAYAQLIPRLGSDADAVLAGVHNSFLNATTRAQEYAAIIQQVFKDATAAPQQLVGNPGFIKVGEGWVEDITYGYHRALSGVPKGSWVPDFTYNIPVVESFGKKLGDGLKKGFAGIVGGLPDTIINAFTGGGGMLGALKAIGTQIGSTVGGSIGSALGKMAAKGGEAAEGLLGSIASLAGPMGAAIGALAGPLIGALGKLFGGPTVSQQLQETVARDWGHALSSGLADAIAETADEVGSQSRALLIHMTEIFEEAGGVVEFGLSKAIAMTSRLFTHVESGVINVADASEMFGDSFKAISDAIIESREIATAAFTDMIASAVEFGVSTADVLKFVTEETNTAAAGLAALFGPTIAEAEALNAKIDEQREKLEDLTEGTDEHHAAQTRLNVLLQTQQELATKSKEELADLGIVAVGAFEAALASGLSFMEAVKATGPAIDSVIAAQEALGITSDNVAIQALSQFQSRIRENEALVTAVEALDDTMLALSRTGALNEETLAAMERQGLRMFERLLEAGFTEQESLLMMGDAIGTIMEAHERLGIPIDENTQKLINQAREAGALEGQQKTGWQAIEAAIDRVVSKLGEMIDAIRGVGSGLRDIPREVRTTIHVRREIETSFHGDEGGGGEENSDIPSGRHGLIGDFGSGTLAMLHGREAVIPLDAGGGDDSLLKEVRALREQIELLPIHLRDAILLSQ